MALKKCVGCGIPLRSEERFCTQCGASQPEERKCAHCGADLEEGMRFCPECGQAAAAAGVVQQSAAQPQTGGQQTSAVPPMTPAAPSAVKVQKPQPEPQAAPQSFAPPSPQNFAPPQGAGAQPFSAPPRQASPLGGQPMPRPTNTPPLGAAGGAFGAGANAAGAAGALGEWKEKLLSFEGRLNRKPYVLRLLAVSVVSSVVVQIISFILGMVIAAIGQSSPELGMVLMFFLYAIIFVLCLPAMVIGISLGIRRCHDNDWPGAAVLLSFVPIVGFVFGLVLLFKPGTPGPNRFGPDPLQ